MPKNDAVTFSLSDIGEALALLTRLPVHSEFTRGARAAWAWPIAGLVVACLAGIVGWAGIKLGLPAPAVAALVIGAQMMMTGALHEDGLADTFDGLWGGFDRHERLEIMKDSHIGSYGVLALILALILRWSALTALVGAGSFAPFLAAVAMSRAPMAVLMSVLPNARGSGLSNNFGHPPRDTAWLAVGAAMLIGLFAIGWSVVVLAFWISLPVAALATIARTKIGGQTGDILGASQQIAEITALLTLAAWL
jgi:adenosylcobinamide-GDP ribazoletransferase